MSKPFEEELCKQTAWVVDAVINNLKLEGFTCKKNFLDEYDIDILIFKDEKIVGKVECELHGKYWGKTFPFKSVRFLGRKTKYIGEKNYYLMVNVDASQCVMIPFRKLKNYKLIKVDNTACKNELMYDVPNMGCVWGWDKVNRFILNDLGK